jgi:hypothetical protein
MSHVSGLHLVHLARLNHSTSRDQYISQFNIFNHLKLVLSLKRTGNALLGHFLGLEQYSKTPGHLVILAADQLPRKVLLPMISLTNSTGPGAPSDSRDKGE